MIYRLRPLIVIIFTSLSTAIALRSYSLILTDVKCTVKNDYITGVSCTLNKSMPEDPRVNIYGKLQKQIRDIRLDLCIELIRPNRNSVTLFRGNNLDLCIIAYANITFPVLRMYRDILMRHGEWPKNCPIPMGFEYNFRDIVLDADYLPKYVPEVDFKIDVTQYDKKVKFWSIEAYGRISHKKKNKVNRKI